MECEKSFQTQSSENRDTQLDLLKLEAEHIDEFGGVVFVSPRPTFIEEEKSTQSP